MATKIYTIKKTEKLPKSIHSFEIEIPALELDNRRSKALKELGRDLELPGFRKGQVPEKILAGRIGELGILEEAARLALNEIIPEIVEEHKLLVVSTPQIRVTKLAPQNPFEAKIDFAILPEITLPDYKKIAKEINGEKKAPTVTDKEFETAIDNLRRHFKTPAATPETEDKKTKEVLPELTDELVKKLGDFKNVADFKEKLKTEMLKDAERKEQERIRLKIVDELTAKTKIDLPEILVEHELDRMTREFKASLERFQMKAEDYLKHLKKTEADMQKEWRPEAEKRAKTQLLVGKIAGAEKLHPTKEEINHEVEHLLEHQKDVNRENAEAYFEMVLTNEKVFEFLESQK